MQTAVAFIIFNRPDTTARVFAEIARARPPRLLVIADGPRPDRPGEAEKCREARAVIERVDWDCEVVTDFSEVNLGLKRRISGGLDWVFAEAEEAIILEDDCLPHPSFFPFCEELLERYRDDERVMMIGGDHFLPGAAAAARYSYFFSRYVGIWGWATWRRAWRHFDLGMAAWAELRDTSLLRDMLGDRADAAYWRFTLDEVAKGYLNTWAFPWLFSCWAQNGLSITPGVNLVSNIGYGEAATNLTSSDAAGDSLPVAAMAFPLRHPPHVVRNREADEFLSRHVFRCRRWGDHGRFARTGRMLLDKVPASARKAFSGRAR